MSEKKRAYEMRARAESQLETRRRITESAVALHGTVGPARTTMSAIAERAGVRRSTVYRHFPDEAAVFDACSAHWVAAHPPPDPSAWAAVADPAQRLQAALDELYGFYGRAAPMLENLHRDESVSELVRERFAAFHAYLDHAVAVLMQGRRERGRARKRARAAVGLAVRFATWSTLVAEQGLDPAEAAALMSSLVEGPRGPS